MAYSKQTWGDNNPAYPASAARFAHLEDGVEDAHELIDNHIADTTDAHDASAISVVDAGGLLVATTVEAALAEIATDVDTVAGAIGAVSSAVSDHIADATAAHAASAVSVADAGGLYAATTVEAALAEVATGLSNHTGDATDAHDASAISYAGGSSTATDVEGAIDALEVTAIYIPRTGLTTLIGTWTGTDRGDSTPVLNSTVATSTQGIGGSVILPSTWNTINAFVEWGPDGTNNGNYVLQFATLQRALDGASYATAMTTETAVTLAGGATAFVSNYDQVATGVAINPALPLHFKVARLGADAADTSTDGIDIIAVYIVKAS